MNGNYAREGAATAPDTAGVNHASRLDSVKSRSFSVHIVSGVVALIDALIIVLAGMGVYLGYVGWSPDSLPVYLLATTVNLALTLSTFYFAGLYNFATITAPFRQIPKVIIICGIAFLLLVAMAFALKISAQFSRVWSFSSFILETFLICLARVGFYYLILNWARAGRMVRNVAVVGAGEQGKKLIDLVQRTKDPWIRIVGIFDDRLDRLPPTVGDYRLVGDLDYLVDYARENRIDDILIALPWSAEGRLMDIMHKLKVLPVHIRLSPDLIGLDFPHRRYEHIGSIPTLSVFEKPITDWRYVLKAIEDRVLAAVILVMVAPLMAMIAAAIKFDSPGPVLFRQKRYGFNNNLFSVFKFRTMIHERPPDIGSAQAKRIDPRVTRLGKFLRRTSLDELPQVFNVLQGTMSLVGPRPLPTALVEEHAPIIEGYYARHRVKPGITGWAQVNGLRGETEIPEKMERRFEYDVYYIENWSILFDLQILAMTAAVMFKQENIY